MKLAVAGKGGVGKTTVTVWLGNYLKKQGKDIWLIDADTALSLGPALGLKPEEVPILLVQQKKLIQERVGSGENFYAIFYSKRAKQVLIDKDY